jgi:hypothetical protein
MKKGMDLDEFSVNKVMDIDEERIHRKAAAEIV